MGPDDYEVLQPLRPRANSYRQALGMKLSCSRKLRAREYDVVEFYGGEAWLATRWLAKRRKRRFLLVQHTNGPEPRYEEMLDRYFGGNRRSWYQFRQTALMKSAFLGVDLVVTVSEYDREWLIKEGFQPPDRVVAIENSIADEFFQEQDSLSKEKRIGFCGTWLPKKGIHVLAEDIGRILKVFPEYRLVLIGVGRSFEKAHYFAEEVCPRVEVIPHIESKAELRKQYARISIFAFPSVIESFGLALAEAMSCGCAVVATKVGFAAGLKDREEALLLDEAKSPMLYHAMRELIVDPELRSRLASNAP
jgi:glycosyltransferase involved in cell wall biosynthesis